MNVGALCKNTEKYLMYVPSYEEHIEPEMQDTFDNIIPQREIG